MSAASNAEAGGATLAKPTAVPRMPLPSERAPSQPEPSAPSAAAESTAPSSPAIVLSDSREPRRIARAAVAAWSKPGLCSGSPEAAGVRETVSARFRLLDLGERGRFYLDPRLPADAEWPLLGDVEQAESEVHRRLGLLPPRPLTFVYFDQQLMKASACINEDVAAFYDGALHIVAGRVEVLASVLHEYAHHAMFSAGLMAPTWAQEGIAMNIAKEQWWRDPRFLRALLDHPFGMDEMDRAIAYKLKPEQAVAFYVQSAALVECVLYERHWSLRELFATLSAGSSLDSLSYDIPELDRRSFLSDCVGHGLNGLPAGQ